MSTKLATLGFVLAALAGVGGDYAFHNYRTAQAISYMESQGCIALGKSTKEESNKYFIGAWGCGNALVVVVKN